MPSKYLAVDATAVHYLHTGPTTLPEVLPALDRGRLLVFVHDAGGNAGIWRRQLDAAAAEHSAVAMDLPGHGRSTGLEGLATIEAYADFLGRFVAALPLRPFVLVGLGMGGAVVLAFGARHPDRAAGLVLACTAARFPVTDEQLAVHRDVVRGRLPQQFATETFSPATGMETMREAWMEQVKTDPRVRYGDLLACQAFDGRPLLGRIGLPTLVVAGADDRLTPVAACAEELARGIAGARLELVREAGHQAPLEQPDAFNDLVARFTGELL